MRRKITIGCLLVLAAFLLFVVRYLVTDDPGTVALEQGTDRSTLVVLMRGLGGTNSISELRALVRAAYPTADILTSTVQPSPFANIDPYRVANGMERGIDAAYQQMHYSHIVLVGYSLGAIILRKTLVWGNGIEDDRLAFGRHGRSEWIDHVERFVSLAGVNRGWSVDPKPDHMPIGRYISYLLGEKLARLTGTGRLLLATERGAPFIADLRVQWIRMIRQQVAPGVTNLPFVVHLLGDNDDVVAMDDSQDINVAVGTSFIKLLNTDHSSLLEVNGPDSDSKDRRQKILDALTQSAVKLATEKPSQPVVEHGIKRAVFVYHGIRDYGLWTDRVRDAVTQAESTDHSGLVVIPAKYGYFPMLPFLLYWDRQRNVRAFMDEYTERLARYPDLEQVDYVGHSNGTYILASALEQYSTLHVHNVFFAGSVVPRYFDWGSLIDRHKVVQVRNVVASADWVVAYFPRFFEQVADWLGEKPKVGLLDIGSAGFRGFDAAASPDGSVRNLKFVSGGHGAAVDVDVRARLDAIVDYIISGRDEKFSVFEDAPTQSSLIDVVSNVCWLVWAVIIGILIFLGRGAARFGRRGLAGYALVLLALLNSV